MVGKHNGGHNVEGHLSLNIDCSLAQAFYVIDFCKARAAVKGGQGEKDCSAGSVGSSIMGIWG